MRRTDIREVRLRVTDRQTDPTTVPSLRMRAEGNNTEMSLPSSQRFHLLITIALISVSTKTRVRGTERCYRGISDNEFVKRWQKIASFSVSYMA